MSFDESFFRVKVGVTTVGKLNIYFQEKANAAVAYSRALKTLSSISELEEIG